MTSTVAVTFDATAVVGAVVDFMTETSPKNSDFPRESTYITIPDISSMLTVPVI